VRAAVRYAAVCLATVVGIGWLISLLYPGSDARAAIVTSAVIACVVQGIGFAIARRMRRTKAPVDRDVMLDIIPPGGAL